MHKMRKMREWQARVQAQSSMSSLGSSLSEADDHEERDVVVAMRRRDMSMRHTMDLLQQSSGWLTTSQRGDAHTEMESRLKELQAKNLRLHMAAKRGLGIVVEEPQVRSDDGPSTAIPAQDGRQKVPWRVQRRQPNLAYGGRSAVYTWSVEEGYRAEAEYSRASDQEGGEGDGEGGSPTEARAGGRMASTLAALRQSRAARAVPGSDLGWLDQLLPSATDGSDTEGQRFTVQSMGDDELWNTPLAKQVMTAMTKLDRGERAKQAKAIRQALAVERLQAKAAQAHSSADNISLVQQRVIDQVNWIRSEITTHVKEIFRKVSEARQKIPSGMSPCSSW